MTYRTSFRHNGKGRVRLLLGEHASTALRILLNGEEAGVLGWEPYELELRACGREKTNSASNLSGSRRNALGPFFLSNPHPLRFGANRVPRIRPPRIPESDPVRTIHAPDAPDAISRLLTGSGK